MNFAPRGIRSTKGNKDNTQGTKRMLVQATLRAEDGSRDERLHNERRS